MAPRYQFTIISLEENGCYTRWDFYVCSGLPRFEKSIFHKSVLRGRALVSVKGNSELRLWNHSSYVLQLSSTLLKRRQTGLRSHFFRKKKDRGSCQPWRCQDVYLSTQVVFIQMSYRSWRLLFIFPINSTIKDLFIPFSSWHWLQINCCESLFAHPLGPGEISCALTLLCQMIGNIIAFIGATSMVMSTPYKDTGICLLFVAKFSSVSTGSLRGSSRHQFGRDEWFYHQRHLFKDRHWHVLHHDFWQHLLCLDGISDDEKGEKHQCLHFALWYLGVRFWTSSYQIMSCLYVWLILIWIASNNFVKFYLSDVAYSYVLLKILKDFAYILPIVL